MSTPGCDATHPQHNRRARAALNLCPLPRPPVRSERAAIVARWFRLDAAARSDAPGAADDPIIDRIAGLLVPGVVVLVTGPSGAGKTWLLRRLVAALARRPVACLDVTGAALPERPIVDCFDPATPLRDVLGRLSRVGLAEAWTYLRTPSELSEGQRARLRLALALEPSYSQTGAPARRVLIADEFAAVLDRITAMIVARALRRAVDEATPARLAALVATSHDDLAPALEPDLVVHCDFGRTVARWGRGSRDADGDGRAVWGNANARRRR